MELNTKNVFELLDLAAETQGRVTGGGVLPFLVSDPGLGKSQIVQQWCDQPSETSKSGKRALLVKVILSRTPAADVSSIPVPDVKSGKIIWYDTGKFIGNVEGAEDYDYVVVFYDELPNAPTDVQVAIQDLIESREANGTFVAPNVVFCAAGNPPESGCGANQLVQALSSRLCHVRCEFSLESWTAYASDVGINPWIIAYHTFKKGESMTNFDPSAEGPQADPRSWEKLSQAIECNPSPYIRQVVGEGIVGLYEYTAFVAFERMTDVVHVEEIIANPSACHIPYDAGTQFAVAANITTYIGGRKAELTIEESNAIIEYLDRVSEVNEVVSNLCVRNSADRNPQFTQCEQYSRYNANHAGL